VRTTPIKTRPELGNQMEYRLESIFSEKVNIGIKKRLDEYIKMEKVYTNFRKTGEFKFKV
jgi:hypothetical protein